MSQSENTAARMRSPLPRLLAALVAVAAALALVACGGSKSPTNAAAAERAGERRDEVELAKFGKCLREHGIETKNVSSGPGHRGFGIRVKGVGGQSKMEAAQRACARFRPAPEKVNLSPQEKVAREEAVMKFAKCMREHGIDLHASTAGGGVQISVGGGPGSGPNPESPAFQSAQKACQGLLPFKHPPGGPAEKSKDSEGGPRLGIGG